MRVLAARTRARRALLTSPLHSRRSAHRPTPARHSTSRARYVSPCIRLSILLLTSRTQTYLTVAASILATEARHSAWIQSSGQKVNPWGGAYQTPLSPNQVFTIASAFITGCPSSNPTLPATPYPALAVASGTPGSTAMLTYTPAAGFDMSTPLYGVFLSGLNTTVVPASADGKSVAVPGNLLGDVFMYLSTDSTGMDETKTVAGPALLDIAYNSNGTVVTPAF